MRQRGHAQASTGFASEVMTLFEAESTVPASGAVISGCGTYRYRLWRVWDDCLPVMVWVMLNPSTADADADDPTIRRCVGFAKRLGFGSIDVLNLFALRSTDPAALWRHPDPRGPDNDEWLLGCRNRHVGSMLVVGFGAVSSAKARNRYARSYTCLAGNDPRCFGLTKDGWPRHPLYLPADAAPQPWRAPSE